MKTIKTLLKEFLSKQSPHEENNEAENPENDRMAPSNDAITTPESINPKTTNNNETETNEMAGNHGMVDPDNSEIDLHDQGEPQENTSIQDLEQRLREAYARGVKDGRNMKIEEEYFPNSDDNIPHFHGNPSPASPFSDIFSMAREA